MAEIKEIYADSMFGFTIHKQGTIAKLIIASNHPDSAGKIVEANKTIFTMPVPSMQEMLNDIQGAIGQPKKGDTKN